MTALRQFNNSGAMSMLIELLGTQYTSEYIGLSVEASNDAFRAPWAKISALVEMRNFVEEMTNA